jgi:hypothetical protein
MATGSNHYEVILIDWLQRDIVKSIKNPSEIGIRKSPMQQKGMAKTYSSNKDERSRNDREHMKALAMAGVDIKTDPEGMDNWKKEQRRATGMLQDFPRKLQHANLRAHLSSSSQMARMMPNLISSLTARSKQMKAEVLVKMEKETTVQFLTRRSWQSRSPCFYRHRCRFSVRHRSTRARSSRSIRWQCDRAMQCTP